MKIRPTAKTWLLLNSGPGSASFNMAVDRRLFAGAESFAVDGILRFYWFMRPAVTLGRFQKTQVVNSQKCLEENVEVVKRPTGGRAVFHRHELTYSLVMPVKNQYFGEGVTTSFAAIASVLRNGLGNLGIEAQLEKSRPAKGTKAEADCFRSAGRYELKAGKAKLLGSAQVRHNGYLLQHGSIYLRHEPGLFEEYLNKSGETTEAKNESVADLHTLLGRSPDREEVRTAIVKGFQDSWDVRFIRTLTIEADTGVDTQNQLVGTGKGKNQ